MCDFQLLQHSFLPMPAGGCSQDMLNALYRAGFREPTPIQAQGWPMALSGQDVIGLAETGSGKTLTYLLPGFVHMSAQPRLRKSISSRAVRLPLDVSNLACLQRNPAMDVKATAPSYLAFRNIGRQL